MALSWPAKDPDEYLDYCIDWTKRLVDDDTIASVEWFLPSTDIEKSKESHDTSKAIVWITGGLAGTTYPILCRVTTAQGRIMDQSVNLKCAAK